MVSGIVQEEVVEEQEEQVVEEEELTIGLKENFKI
jgi:hypothetical protein